jgi:hypothetical protein
MCVFRNRPIWGMNQRKGMKKLGGRDYGAENERGKKGKNDYIYDYI